MDALDRFFSPVAYTTTCANCRKEIPMASFADHFPTCRAGYTHIPTPLGGRDLAFCNDCRLPITYDAKTNSLIHV